MSSEELPHVSGSLATTSASVHIRPARIADIEVLARLMTEAISWGRLGELGPAFVRLLHRHMVRTRHGVCIVAEDGGAVVGYIAAATDTRRFYREFLLRYGLLAGVLVVPSLWHPRHLKTAVRGLTHFPAAPRSDPLAEALSFAVQPGIRTRGIGTLLFRSVVNELKARGVTVVKFATVDAENATGNAFYRKLGCRLIRTVPFYRNKPANVYFYTIERDA